MQPSYITNNDSLISVHLKATTLSFRDAVNNRQLQLSNPIFGASIHTDFKAIPGMPGMPSPSKRVSVPLEEYLGYLRAFWCSRPQMRMEFLDLDTNVDERKGRAQVFVNYRVVDGETGLVRTSVGMFWFVRAEEGLRGWKCVTLDLAAGVVGGI